MAKSDDATTVVDTVREVDVHQAKTHLSRLLAEVGGGEDVVIGRTGTPIARLDPSNHV